jgi:CBS domain containing-hemolysin-like protein
MHAFTRTNQFMVVVINSFEEAVGVITLDGLLEELIGSTQDAELMVYDDRAAIASFKLAKKKQTVAAEPENDDTEPAPETTEKPVASPEATEVVE